MNLDKHWFDLPCPRCNYTTDVQMISMRLEDMIICNNCKSNIRLQDSTASVHIGMRNIEQSWNELLNVFKKLN